MGNTRSRVAAAAAVLAVLAAAPAARATDYFGVEVVVESDPTGTASHGYAELWVKVVNRSSERARTVCLTLPRHSYSPGTDYLRAVTRTVTVEPGKTVRVPLAYPVRLAVSGSELGVAIDGVEQEDGVPFSGFRGSRYGSHSYGSSSLPKPLVLYSREVDTRFPDWVNTTHHPIPGGWKRTAHETEFARADQPAAAWSPNWLGYTRYDGIVVTANELAAMPAEVRTAVGQYVECGGALLVLGPGGPLPGKWKPERIEGEPLSVAAAGFGECLVASGADLSKWDAEPVDRVVASWQKTMAPWGRDPTPAEANRQFPVIETTQVPVKGLLALMFVFVILIGPVNLFVLARKKRKLWQFWTVPLVSLVTCLGVFGYMALTEGWSGRTRAEGLTVLDENTRRAATLGWTAYYTPLLPGGGLHFGTDTEVALRNGEERGYGYSYRRRGGGSALSVDWTKDQHLASGWLTPRVPAHFAVRKGEARRERVTIARAADGRLEAVNGLGADVTELWYADEAGSIFKAGPVPAGGRAELKAAGQTVQPPAKRKPLREIYATGDWARAADQARAAAPTILAPRTYLAVMDAAPFLDDALPGASVRKAKSAVYGILREGGDDN
jgi:hypothetical protein